MKKSSMNGLYLLTVLMVLSAYATGISMAMNVTFFAWIFGLCTLMYGFGAMILAKRLRDGDD